MYSPPKIETSQLLGQIKFRGENNLELRAPPVYQLQLVINQNDNTSTDPIIEPAFF